ALKEVRERRHVQGGARALPRARRRRPDRRVGLLHAGLHGAQRRPPSGARKSSEMRLRTPAIACAFAVLAAGPVFADPPKEVMNIVREADIKFAPARYPGSRARSFPAAWLRRDS